MVVRWVLFFRFFILLIVIRFGLLESFITQSKVVDKNLNIVNSITLSIKFITIS